MLLPFIFGFGTGVYVGTYYECKKTLETIKERVKKLAPEKKE